LHALHSRDPRSELVVARAKALDVVVRLAGAVARRDDTCRAAREGSPKPIMFPRRWWTRVA